MNMFQLVANDVVGITDRVRYFRGTVSNFNESEARKHFVLASDWLIFEILPENTKIPCLLYNFRRNYPLHIIRNYVEIIAYNIVTTIEYILS